MPHVHTANKENNNQTVDNLLFLFIRKTSILAKNRADRYAPERSHVIHDRTDQNYGKTKKNERDMKVLNCSKMSQRDKFTTFHRPT